MRPHYTGGGKARDLRGADTYFLTGNRWEKEKRSYSIKKKERKEEGVLGHKEGGGKGTSVTNSFSEKRPFCDKGILGGRRRGVRKQEKEGVRRRLHHALKWGEGRHLGGRRGNWGVKSGGCFLLMRHHGRGGGSA